MKRRLGITIKCRCTSVSRMKVKRVVREWFRTRDESFDGYDYNVVIPATVKVCFPYWEQLKEGLSKVKTNDFRIRTRSQARR